MADLTADVGADLTAKLPDLRSRRRLDAVVEAARAAALVAVPRLRSEHDAVLDRRGPGPQAPAPRRWGSADVAAVVALLLGLLAAGLVLPSPRNGRSALGVDTAAIWVGVTAAAALVIFALLEGRRRDTLLLGAHTRGASKLYVVLAVVWALVFGYILANWSDIDRFEPQQPTVGLVLLGLSVAGIGALAFIARRRDRVALTDPAIAAKDEWGRSASDADPLEQWWRAWPQKLSAAERGAADRSYGVAIDVLEREGVIRPSDARRLRRKNPPVVWRGDAA